jgi:hypothetical protein
MEHLTQEMPIKVSQEKAQPRDFRTQSGNRVSHRGDLVGFGILAKSRYSPVCFINKKPPPPFKLQQLTPACCHLQKTDCNAQPWLMFLLQTLDWN